MSQNTTECPFSDAAGTGNRDWWPFEGRDRKTGDVKWTGTRVDLVFGSSAHLRARRARAM
jgi:catalase (peroxidase I)